MKVSVVIPVLNEETGIKRILDSIFNQTYLPTEIVVADGGSTDNTVQVINSYSDRGIPIKVVHNEKVLPGAGRNAGVRNAAYDVIACADAGNAARPDWLKELVSSMESDSTVDVVYGKYIPDPTTPFEDSVTTLVYGELRKCFAANDGVLVNNKENRKGDVFFGGTSVCFRKSAWEKVGGFPDWLRAGEDKLFGKKLINAGFKVLYNPRAIVGHHMRSNPRQVFKLIFVYERADRRTTQTGDKKRVLRLLPKYIVGLALLILSFYFPILFAVLVPAVGYHLYRTAYAQYIFRFDRRPKLKELWHVPFIVIPVDMGFLFGTLFGLWDYYTKSTGYKEKLAEYNDVTGINP